MARLSTSTYPEHPTKERDIAYMREAGKLGCRRIFICLSSISGGNREEVIGRFYRLADEVHAYGMEIIPDVSPAVLSRLEISFGSLSVFREMHVSGIWLDEGFGGMKESLMIYNPQELKMELNTNVKLVCVENITDHHPDREKLTTCHNFYLQIYTELSLKHFNRCNDKTKSLGLRVAMLVPSNASGAYGSQPLNEGLCILEIHHGLPLDFQVHHMFATGMMDDALTASVYATDKESNAHAAVNSSILTSGIGLEKELTDAERQILDYEPKHMVRGDVNEYMIRSTYPKVVFTDQSIPTVNTRDLKQGDVVILSNGYLRHEGELHIVAKDIPNDGCKNVTGRPPEHEHVLLDYIEPWKVFASRVI